ncbi:transcriptional regulator [Flexivirga endophytica]|uniref:Transcriptional regulator n=1 Tax=Flexivirga endophytica TaxID=1849103 RepID=A0A916WM06_9MICO|nr:IclR family transcriptional regulator [Flexivirga endophytica]GGB14846.1 transcriptional regulator [Flexivirga endophytica]GHB65401.1 transcriptional regulator [Flexivirga endophytica]
MSLVDDGVPTRGGSVRRTLQILELVAARGGASAKEISDAIDLPLPTVYRLVRELLDSEYLVHIRTEKRFELGYKLHQLALSLHQQIGVPRPVRTEIVALHQRMGAAAYFAIHRGSQIVVVQTAESPAAPRLKPIDFGFHEAAHATALGKILLADMDDEQRERHLDPEPMPRFGPGTLITHGELAEQLAKVADSGIAWEIEEFQPGASCCAAAVRSASGSIVGSVAVSAPKERFAQRRAVVEHELRCTASAVSRYYRSGHTG